MFTESFGMQLDDDSLLALYYVYDPEGSGCLHYEDIVKQLLDGDYYAMYSPAGVDNTQVGGGVCVLGGWGGGCSGLRGAGRMGKGRRGGHNQLSGGIWQYRLVVHQLLQGLYVFALTPLKAGTTVPPPSANQY
jgi:hypothetical protein